MGSKDSGFRAWAQNMRSQVCIDFWGNNERDLVDVVVKPSTQSYSSGYIRLLQNADIDALLSASAAADAQTQRHLNAARQSLEKADAAARKFQAKADKLKEKARA